jgi:hypothetical protein
VRIKICFWPFAATFKCGWKSHRDTFFSFMQKAKPIFNAMERNFRKFRIFAYFRVTRWDCEKKLPKIWPNPVYFCHKTFTAEKSSPKFGLLVKSSVKQHKINYHPIGEKSPSLVTLPFLPTFT